MESVSLKKNVGLIHHVTVGNPLTLLAKKLFNALLLNAHRGLLERERHEISIQDLTTLVGFNSKNTDVLKSALRQLVETRMEWNVLGDAGESEWGVTAALAEAKLWRGVCSYAYAPTMREKLANPEVYALIDLQLQRQFKSTYTASLFENVVRYRRVGRTPVIEVDTLLGLLGLSGSKTYKQFKYLNRDVLTPAIDEINSKSDIRVSMLTARRLGRRVTAVQFEVREAELSVARQATLERLREFSVEGRDARQAMTKHSDEKLMAILDEIQRRHESGSIKNLRAYTVTVLRDFEGDVVPPLQQEREAKKRDREASSRQKAEAEERRRKQQKAFAKFQVERVAEEERGLTDEDAAQLHNEFLEHLKTNVPFAFETYSKAGENSSLVQYELRAFKIKRLLPPEDQRFETWLVENSGPHPVESSDVK
jgi:hypothetical protein